jgi:hypothetical protein
MLRNTRAERAFYLETSDSFEINSNVDDHNNNNNNKRTHKKIGPLLDDDADDEPPPLQLNTGITSVDDKKNVYCGTSTTNLL